MRNTRRMLRALALLAIAALGALPVGCMSFATHVAAVAAPRNVYPGIYGGARLDLAYLADRRMDVMSAVDLPFSLALDTLFLPVDVAASIVVAATSPDDPAPAPVIPVDAATTRGGPARPTGAARPRRRERRPDLARLGRVTAASSSTPRRSRPRCPCRPS